MVKKQRESLKDAIIKSESSCKVIQKILNNAMPSILISCTWIFFAKDLHNRNIIGIISFIIYFTLWLFVTWYIWAVPSFLLLKRHKVHFVYYLLVVMMVILMFVFSLQSFLQLNPFKLV